MGQIKTPDDIKQLGIIMSVWAHPDDESFLAAGILSTAVQNGQEVVCITATKGEAGIQDESRWPATRLGDIRANELKRACKILSINNHHWLGYSDTHCDQVNTDEAVNKLQAFIEQYQPDTILTFGPDGWTGNPDHSAVSDWVKRVVKESARDITVFHVVGTKHNYEKYLKPIDEKINIFYNIDKPILYESQECDICFELSTDIQKLKLKALSSMESQTEALFELFDKQFLAEAWANEYYIKAS